MKWTVFFTVILIPLSLRCPSILECTDPRQYERHLALQLTRQAYLDSNGVYPIGEELLRIKAIADDIVSVVYDPAEPYLLDDPSKIKTMLLVVATMKSESHFSEDVEYGRGDVSLGSDGKNWCLMQIRLGRRKSGLSTSAISFVGDSYKVGVKEQFNGADLLNDRKLCIRAGLHVIRNSLDTCRNYPEEFRLSAYLSGSCKKANRASKHRMSYVRRLQDATHFLTSNIDKPRDSML